MIYLQNTDNSQQVRIPRSLPTPAGADLSLVLRSTMLEGESTLSVTDTSTSTKYYLFAVTLSGQVSGEYEYKVKAGTAILAQGVLRILEAADSPQVEVQQYGTTIEIEQYGRIE